MTLTFFADHCVPNFVIQALGDITTYPPARYKGIIALQVKNHPEVIPAILRRLIAYLSVHAEMASYEGQLFLVEAHRIRIRR